MSRRKPIKLKVNKNKKNSYMDKILISNIIFWVKIFVSFMALCNKSSNKKNKMKALKKLNQTLISKMKLKPREIFKIIL